MTRPRALVIDDETELCEILSDFLSPAFDVVVCSAPTQAKELIQPETQGATEGAVFDLVLTDLSMPVVSGLEIIRLVEQRRRVTGQPRPLAVAISGLGADSPLVRDALAAGAVEVIAKPFGDPDEVLVRLLAILKRSG